MSSAVVRLVTTVRAFFFPATSTPSSSVSALHLNPLCQDTATVPTVGEGSRTRVEESPSWERETALEVMRLTLVLWIMFRRIMTAIGVYFLTSGCVVLTQMIALEALTEDAAVVLTSGIVHIVFGLTVLVLAVLEKPPSGRTAVASTTMRWTKP